MKATRKTGIHYSATLLLLSLVSVLISVTVSPAKAGNVYQAGEVITGQVYNELVKAWFDHDVTIFAGIDEDSPYIYVQAETGLANAVVAIEDEPATRKRLIGAVEKALYWSDVARNNSADTLKLLGCFGRDPYGVCESHGAFEEGQLSLSFFAANSGRQTNLILQIIDRSNQFIKADIYLDPPQMRQLLAALQDLDRVIAHARRMQAKDNLFQ
jgi:hypothetical protein